MSVSAFDARRTGVRRPLLAHAPAEPFGPARIAHWSSAANLDLLGTYLMVFDSTGVSDPWTLAYEESLYVISGEAWIVELAGEDECTSTASVGDLLVITRGATVRYGGMEGTQLLLSIAPVNWDTEGA
ncbi:hypothetical protein [Mycobacterium sp. AT1]|uniref:hypothetical protein n=1 Tax=Mycobacterium sp. AT1 TaxID=1961706 RepID=UPI0009AEE023|nr:hypothetical protein [Mycobacterium sp. AT1]OPX09496.1 hypothetical protein B1790_15645 [Mycobacterium sp. AT1]